MFVCAKDFVGALGDDWRYFPASLVKRSFGSRVGNADRIIHVRKMHFNPYPTAFPYGNGMVLHFYQQQESSTTKTVHKVINKGLKAYV